MLLDFTCFASTGTEEILLGSHHSFLKLGGLDIGDRIILSEIFHFGIKVHSMQRLERRVLPIIVFRMTLVEW